MADANQPPPLSEFGQFIDKAIPLLILDLPDRLAPFRQTLEHLRQALVCPKDDKDKIEYDILKVAGLTNCEDAYTELMVWCLQLPKIGVMIQRTWLKSLGIPNAGDLMQVWAQFPTDAGRPDMVLRYSDFVVVVEAKTGSEEHEVRSTGDLQTETYVKAFRQRSNLGPNIPVFQTEIYPEAVRRKLNLGPEVHVFMVFLTPDGRLARNPKAIPTTYLTFAAALASSLDSSVVDDNLRHVLRLLITHLANQALPPPGMDPRKVLEDVAFFLDNPKERDAKILESLRGVNLLIELLPRRIDNE